MRHHFETVSDAKIWKGKATYFDVYTNFSICTGSELLQAPEPAQLRAPCFVAARGWIRSCTARRSGRADRATARRKAKRKRGIVKVQSKPPAGAKYTETTLYAAGLT